MGGIVNDHFLNKYLTKFLHSKAFTKNIYVFKMSLPYAFCCTFHLPFVIMKLPKKEHVMLQSRNVLCSSMQTIG